MPQSASREEADSGSVGHPISYLF